MNSFSAVVSKISFDQFSITIETQLNGEWNDLRLSGGLNFGERFINLEEIMIQKDIFLDFLDKVLIPILGKEVNIIFNKKSLKIICENVKIAEIQNDGSGYEMATFRTGQIINIFPDFY